MTIMASQVAVLSLYLLLVFGRCISSPVGSSCSDDVDLACTNKPFHDALHDGGFSLLSEETLNEHCSDILEDINCKGKYLSACDPTGYEAFALTIDGFKDVLSDLCNKSSLLRKEFQKHSSCLASMSDLYEDCMMNSVQVATGEEMEGDEDIVSSEAAIKRMCRFYEPVKTCVTRDTRTYCGDSAAQFIEQFIVRAAAPAISSKCQA